MYRRRDEEEETKQQIFDQIPRTKPKRYFRTTKSLHSNEKIWIGNSIRAIYYINIFIISYIPS
jgi:hypothetical protein